MVRNVTYQPRIHHEENTPLVTILETNVELKQSIAKDSRKAAYVVDLTKASFGWITYPKPGSQWYLKKISGVWALMARAPQQNPQLNPSFTPQVGETYIGGEDKNYLTNDTEVLGDLSVTGDFSSSSVSTNSIVYNGIQLDPITWVYVTTGLSKTNDTLEEVPGFVFPVELGYAYVVHALIAYTGPTNADIQFDWSRSGGVENSDIRRFIIGLATDTATNMNSTVLLPRRDGDTNQQVGADGGAGSGSTSYIEHVVVIPSGDGIIGFRAAQVSTSETPTNITTASRLVVTRGLVVT